MANPSSQTKKLRGTLARGVVAKPPRPFAEEAKDWDASSNHFSSSFTGVKSARQLGAETLSELQRAQRIRKTNLKPPKPRTQLQPLGGISQGVSEQNLGDLVGGSVQRFNERVPAKRARDQKILRNKSF